MVCVFKPIQELSKRSTKVQKQNQCYNIKTQSKEDIQMKDNYQQSYKTRTTTTTKSTHQKSPAQVLLTARQQKKFFQVARNIKDALTTHESVVTTIDIKALSHRNTSQINFSNCYGCSLEINRKQHRSRRHWCQYHGGRSCTSCTVKSNDIAAEAALADISCLRLDNMLLHAKNAPTASLDESGKTRQENGKQNDIIIVKPPITFLPWGLNNVASAVVPATMSAAILSTLSTTLTAGYQYLSQHYKQYSQSFSFYAASSVILVLCYLTTTSTAAATQSETGAVDKHPIFDESSSDKEILDLLLEKKRYDKRLLPPVNDEDFCCGLQSPDMATNQNARRPHNRGTLTVNVNVLLLSLASPDESSLKYEVEFLLNQQWNDPRLQYGNKSHYDFLNALHHHDSIWTPDTYFIMHGDFKDPIIPMHFALRIFRNGTITYAMRRHLILSCQGSLHIFPFDDPKCSFSMESISYEEAQIKYVWKNDEDTLRKSPSLTTLNAYLIKNQTTACDQNSWRGNYSCLRVDLIFTRDRAFYFTTVFIPGIILVTSSFITFWLEWNAVPARSMIGNYSCLQVELTFTRDRAYYFTTVFIPGIILVTSSFITFWLEWNAVPARVMIGVTTMLNFFTTSNGFRSTLPVVSNLTAMNVWDGVCMCFIYASLLEFVCVNYVGRKRPLHNVVYRPGENPVTQRLPAVLSRIGVILASPLASTVPMSVMTSTTHSMSPVGSTATPSTPTRAEEEFVGGMRWQEEHGGIIGAAVQNLRARSIKRKINYETTKKAASQSTSPCVKLVSLATGHIYEEPALGAFENADLPATSVKLKNAQEKEISPTSRRSVATGTPSLVVRIEQEKEEKLKEKLDQHPFIELDELHRQSPLPIRPPRRIPSRSNSPCSTTPKGETILTTKTPTTIIGATEENGEKRREAGAPNEIVACTTCGSTNSPCTHSANNGCATETCFVQMRKKEPPHPIRVAKTIDVIARITFPTAYAIFLIFFFVHYKGFS